MELPDYFGRNLDALWDCITGGIKLPLKLIWDKFDKIESSLDNEFINELETLFKEAEKELGDLFEVEYK